METNEGKERKKESNRMQGCKGVRVQGDCAAEASLWSEEGKGKGVYIHICIHSRSLEITMNPGRDRRVAAEVRVSIRGSRRMREKGG